MNKAIAHILKQQLTGLPLIDKIAGLVQVEEYEDKIYDEAGINAVTYNKRIPVSCDVTDGLERTDLVPDKSKKGIIYFEDNGVMSLGKQQGLYRFSSRLRLVCWFNKELAYNNACYDTEAILMAGIIDKLHNLNMVNIDNFIRIAVNVEGIPKVDKSIFAPYTYDLSNTGYLMPPYGYFAIDLTVAYSMHPSCLDTLHVPQQMNV